MHATEEEQKESFDEEGRSELMEEAGKRVKVGQKEIKEDGERTNQRKMERKFLWLVMTSTGKLKDVSAAS